MSKTPEYSPWLPEKWDPAIVSAVKAVAVGTGTAEQQRKVIEYIVGSNDGVIPGLCRTYDAVYFPSERDTAFANGKRHVGLQIVKLISLTRVQIGRVKTDKAPTEQG
jgi:hypothetical protein